MKKIPTIRLNARSLADQRVKLVRERHGQKVDATGRGLRPVGESIWRVINGLRRGIH